MPDAAIAAPERTRLKAKVVTFLVVFGIPITIVGGLWVHQSERDQWAATEFYSKCIRVGGQWSRTGSFEQCLSRQRDAEYGNLTRRRSSKGARSPAVAHWSCDTRAACEAYRVEFLKYMEDIEQRHGRR